MIKVNTLHSLLNVSDEELKNLDEEQLRLMLGIFRYLTRVVERELNERGHDLSTGTMNQEISNR